MSDTVRPPHIQAEIDGMRALNAADMAGDPEPWVTRLKPPHPVHVAKAAGALVAITRSRQHAYQIAYTLADVGLLKENG